MTHTAEYDEDDYDADEYNIRISGHDEDCSYWIEDDNCCCHLFERDLAYTNGYRAAVNKMREQGDVFEERGWQKYKDLTDEENKEIK